MLRLRVFGRALEETRQPPADDIEDGSEDEAEDGDADHAGEDAVPRECRISAPALTAHTSGTTPRMNASDVITMGRIRSRAASRVAGNRPAFSYCSGELDDEDCIFARQPDEHDIADLGEDVVSRPRIVTPTIEADEGTSARSRLSRWVVSGSRTARREPGTQRRHRAQKRTPRRYRP